jgi:hypothetical protein
LSGGLTPEKGSPLIAREMMDQPQIVGSDRFVVPLNHPWLTSKDIVSSASLPESQMKPLHLPVDVAQAKQCSCFLYMRSCLSAGVSDLYGTSLSIFEIAIIPALGHLLK